METAQAIFFLIAVLALIVAAFVESPRRPMFALLGAASAVLAYSLPAIQAGLR